MAKFNETRQHIYQYDSIDTSVFESITLDDFITMLQRYKEKHGGDGKFHLDIEYYYDNANVSVKIDSYRKETDEEFEQRMERHKLAEKMKRDEAKRKKQEREEFERKEFERLSKKYGRVVK